MQKIEAVAWYARCMNRSYGHTAEALDKQRARMVYRAYKKAREKRNRSVVPHEITDKRLLRLFDTGGDAYAAKKED